MRPTLATTGRWLGAAALAVALALPAQAQRNVTLRLNTASLPDTIKTEIAQNLQVRGCLDGCTDNQSPLPDGNTIAWDSRTTVLPGNDDGDYWSVSFQIPDNQQLNFKFYAQQSEDAGIGGWEDGDNLSIGSGTGDVALDLHYFNKTGGNQAYDWRPFPPGGADSVAVWFRVYMNTEAAVAGGFDGSDGSTTVHVRGDNVPGGAQGGRILDWGANNINLRRESEDPARPGYFLYSGRVAYPRANVGQTQAYKFVFADSATPVGWEGTISDRTFQIPAADTTLYWKYFDDSPPIVGPPPVTAPVIFTVDTTPLVAAGVFDQNSGDTMQLRGEFNGWDCPAEADDCRMTRTPGTLEYVIQVPIRAQVGSELNYKFFVDFQGPSYPDSPDAGYEEPLDEGGGNNTFEFAGVDQDLGTQFYNDIRPANVIPAGTSVAVTFRVDMEPATTFDVTPFNPATDTVRVGFEDVVWQITQGYEPGELDEGLIPGFILTDPDGDLVYEGTLNVNGPTYNGIGYAYVYGSNGVNNREGRGGFSAGRRRYRYVLADGGGTFPSAFTFALDTFRPFGSSGDLLPWEVNPTDPDGASEYPTSIPNGQDDFGVATEPVPGERPTTLVLAQSSPNPVRGAGQIEYALPQDGPVRLAVYDVTGRQVLVLVDEALRAGTYRTTFDVAGLPAGVYVYRLRAASGVAAGRLTVVR